MLREEIDNFYEDIMEYDYNKVDKEGEEEEEEIDIYLNINKSLLKHYY